ncbi:N-acetyltransferase family protein [Ornithinimicrobium sp. Y1847]|uniref:GNAT family N-acetyltransferase n=1 Tax=Ornithinimicrobium sp. Y1847 TaxID=3405419 RepID=UPI003B6704B9
MTQVPESAGADRRGGRFSGSVIRLGPEDWRDYRELRLRMLRESPEAYWTSYPDLVDRSEEFWRERSNPGTFHARIGGRPVGTLTMIDPRTEAYADELGADDGLLVAVYVVPAHRGSGVVDALMEAATDVATHERYARRLVLHVLETNRRAIAAYERLGFTLDGRWIQHPERDVRDLQMIRTL